LQAVEFFEVVDHPSEGKIRQMRNPTTWSATPLPALRPAPRLGEHSREVLREVGYTDAQISEMLAAHITTAG
jgi:crotonobetainyl-CoA:carnitine CoA-transferase CaiB-like acyl-CoA transferase